MIFDIVTLIEPQCEGKTTNPIIDILQSLWKVYWNKIDFSIVYNINANTGSSNIKNPPGKNLGYYLDDVYQQEINEYYGTNPEKQLNYDEEYCRNIEKKCIELTIKNKFSGINQYNSVEKLLSLMIIKFKKYANLPIDQSNEYTNYSYCNFSGKDFSKKRIESWNVTGSNFQNAIFTGDGSIDTCIHWNHAKKCNFTDAQFNGKICHKGSHYDGSNFTRVDMTALMYNASMCKMINCDFTDSYVIVDNHKLMGNNLLKYLAEEKKIPINGSKYDSPKDGGYNSTTLDEKIWGTI